jgi:3'-phosphoadenosine 5'-phosphosulfate sulfotransferase (PAPS reductase)/FAD synthetase
MNKQELTYRQNLSLEDKIIMTNERIKEWYDAWEGQVYISFSGGKDSTVLLDLVRKLYPDVKAVFINTGLEYPEILKFIKTIENVDVIRPKMRFKDVIDKYGYPVISKENAQKIYDIRNTKSEKFKNKRLYGDEKGNGKLPEKWKYLIDSDIKISSYCCNILKKYPIKKYEKVNKLAPFVGTMASDSRLRETNYLKNGCNSFNARPMSLPMSFWLEKDVWEYINKYNIPYSTIYDKGYERTGCMFCMIGLHLDKNIKNKFEIMKETHPKHYNYCINKLECGKVLDLLNIKY